VDKLAPSDFLRYLIVLSRLPALVRGSEPQETLMVALTFPDGARRDYPPGTTGLDIAKGISPSLGQAHRGHGA
jgi:hypothetical protein